MTGSIEAALTETNRRRERQHQYNQDHHINPTTVQKNILPSLAKIAEADYITVDIQKKSLTPKEIEKRKQPLKKK